MISDDLLNFKPGIGNQAGIFFTHNYHKGLQKHGLKKFFAILCDNALLMQGVGGRMAAVALVATPVG